MNQIDKIKQPIGIFSLKVTDKDGNVVDEYKEKNLIMDKAKITMAQLIGGVTPVTSINKFILGTRGHKNDNVLTPKQVGEEDGFTSDLTQTFSQSENKLYYTIDFNPVSDSLEKECTDVVGYFNGDSSNTESGNTVKRTITDSEIEYEIVIPLDNANNPDTNELAVYTECSLNCGDNIFSMKTFPARVKEDSVQYTINYKIIF